MIPEKLLVDAQAEYRGNVHHFLTLGEGKALDRFDYIRIKQRYLNVQDWFDSFKNCKGTVKAKGSTNLIPISVAVRNMSDPDVMLSCGPPSLT